MEWYRSRIYGKRFSIPATLSQYGPNLCPKNPAQKMLETRRPTYGPNKGADQGGHALRHPLRNRPVLWAAHQSRTSSGLGSWGRLGPYWLRVARMLNFFSHIRLPTQLTPCLAQCRHREVPLCFKKRKLAKPLTTITYKYIYISPGILCVLKLRRVTVYRVHKAKPYYVH